MNSTTYRIMFVSVFVLVTALPIGEVSAYGFCSTPSEPSCINMLGISKDDFTFQMCRSELESYRQQVQSYIRCMVDEVNMEKEKQARELDRAIDRFNCYAKGGTTCF